MSESSGAQDASTLVLRISVPASADYQVILKELAAKVAVYLGDTDSDGRAAADALDQVTATLASGAGNGDIVFEFRQAPDALLIRAHADGRSADVRRPLPSQA